MDFFKLLKQGNYIVDVGNEFLWDCWPNTHSITLTPDDDHSIIIFYDIKTLHIHEVEIVAFNVGTGTSFGQNIEFKWFDPESRKSYISDSKYVDWRDNHGILIEDEEEMNFITLKLKYM